MTDRNKEVTETAIEILNLLNKKDFKFPYALATLEIVKSLIKMKL